MSVSLAQIVIIALVAVLLFGSGKISSLMADVAKGIKSFRKSMSEDDLEADESDIPKIATSRSDKVVDIAPTDKDAGVG